VERTLSRLGILALIAFGVGAVIAPPGHAADEQTFNLTIRDHHFDPASLDVPANAKFKLVVRNEDATAEEFESGPLHREKVVKGNSEITILIGPLKPGSYSYYGEYHEDTAKGVLVAK
jgi:hypothetical protein